MRTIRIWVIVAAAAFLASPLAHAQSHDCDRYPMLCEQSTEAKAAADAASQVTAPVKKRKASRRQASPSKPAPAPRHPPGSARAAREPGVGEDHDHRRSRAAATVAGDAAPAPAVAAPTDSPALGGGRCGSLCRPMTPARVRAWARNRRASECGRCRGSALRQSRRGQRDRPRREGTRAAGSSWLRFLLATLGAALAAASMAPSLVRVSGRGDAIDIVLILFSIGRASAGQPRAHARLHAPSGCGADRGREVAQGATQRHIDLPPVWLRGHRQDHARQAHRQGDRRQGAVRGLHRQGRLRDAQQGLPRRLHHPQPDLPAARERRGAAELRAVERRAGLEGEAHRHRRMLDGRCRAGARPDVVSACRCWCSAIRRNCRRSRAAASSPTPSPTPCSPRSIARRATIRSSGCRWTSAPALSLAEGQYGDTQVVRRAELDPKRVLDADQVLVGRNVTRRAYNARLRQRRGFTEPLPMAGDKLVCLRNNRRKGLFNGGLWMVKERPKVRRQILSMRL